LASIILTKSGRGIYAGGAQQKRGWIAFRRHYGMLLRFDWLADFVRQAFKFEK